MIAIFTGDLISEVESRFLTSTVKNFEQQKRTHYAFLTTNPPQRGAWPSKRYMGPAGGSPQAKNTLAFNYQRPQKKRGLNHAARKKNQGGFLWLMQ